MNDKIMPPKPIKVIPIPLTVRELLLKLKEQRDQSQMESILLQFHQRNSLDPHIASVFNTLGYDPIKEAFPASLSLEEVISLIESQYVESEVPIEQCDDSKQEDTNSTIIKKPIPTSILSSANIITDETLNHQYLASSALMEKAMLYQEGSYELNPNSMNKTLLFSSIDNNSNINNNINIPSFSFRGKSSINPNTNTNSNEELRINSPFHKIIPDPTEDLKLNTLGSTSLKTLLNKKRIKPPIVLDNNNNDEPTNDYNTNKRSLRPSSSNKKYKTPSMNKTNKPMTTGQGGRTSGYGLKEISNRVKEIIKRSGTTSYKEISDEIVSEINEKDSKDEKNIRRRIYDSLNVMKSMKLFKKDKTSKRIAWTFIDEIPQCNSNNSTSVTHHHHSHNKREDNGNNQSEYIKTLNQDIKIKLTKLNSLQREYNSLNTVIERNKTNNELYEEKNKISFPFIVIEFPNNKTKDSKVKVSMNETKTQAHFAFDSADKLYGDLEAVSKIGLNINQYNSNNKTK